MKDKYKNEDWLEKEYLDNGRSTVEIANECNVTPNTIGYWMKKFGIPRRSHARATELASNNGERYKNKEWLVKKYFDEGETQEEIATEAGVAKTLITYWMNKHNIERGGQTICKGFKMCSCCRKWKSVEKFGSRSGTSTGLSSRCNSCEHKRHKEYKKKKNDDPQYRLNNSISASIRASITKGKDDRHWEYLVGYSLEDLKEHLEKKFERKMTWDNYGDWHIDHIKPKSAFNFSTPDDEEFRECWALENLQPLWAKDNLSKGDKYCE